MSGVHLRCCYRGMLKEKRREVGDKAGKLKGGLQKLQETGEQVANMQVGHFCLPCCMCSAPLPTASSLQVHVDRYTSVFA